VISRRRFVQHAAVVASLAAAPAGGLPVFCGASAATRDGSAVLPDANRLKLYVALFDRRFAAARLFARAIGSHAIPLRAIDADVTDLWFSELHPGWKLHSLPVAGLTTYGPLFCLERLAWDHGMRVVHRTKHLAIRDDAIAAVPNTRGRPSKRAATELWAADAAAAIAGFPRSRARLAAASPAETAFAGAAVPVSAAGIPVAETAAVSASVTGEALRPGAGPEGALLYSWIIAPRVR